MFTCSLFSSKLFCCLLKENTFSSSVMFPKVNLTIPFLQLMMALDVARNGLPKMTGISLAGFATGCISRTMKSTGK
ncbi:hypothetical protein LguiA_030697 [Lonicera macranthoides]